jgi:hypothetical protein
VVGSRKRPCLEESEGLLFDPRVLIRSASMISPAAAATAAVRILRHGSYIKAARPQRGRGAERGATTEEAWSHAGGGATRSFPSELLQSSINAADFGCDCGTRQYC